METETDIIAKYYECDRTSSNTSDNVFKELQNSRVFCLFLTVTL